MNAPLSGERAKTFSSITAITVVIGSMIGTGVFTSLGFQLQEFHAGFSLMALWVVGGICAFCGALTYAELAAAYPRSGGEYRYLREIFHPSIGFAAGWISMTIGFSAPTALVALTFGSYLSAAIEWIDSTLVAYALILVVAGVHLLTHRTSGSFQTWFTTLKVILIVAFCILACFWVATPSIISFEPTLNDLSIASSGGFAVSLIFVNYAYSGWNATTYITEEFNQPSRTVTRALIGGTLLVLLLYLALNFTFLYVAPISALEGKIEIGYVAAEFAFGKVAANAMSITIAIMLVSTISAMTLAGPRVLHQIGQDFRTLRWLSITNDDGIPTVAILSQTGLAILFILTGSFQAILVFSGFTLGLCLFATVLGAIWRRFKLGPPASFRMPLFPLPALVFLVITGWTLVYVLIQRPIEGLVSLITIAMAFFLYFMLEKLQPSSDEPPPQDSGL